MTWLSLLSIFKGAGSRGEGLLELTGAEDGLAGGDLVDRFRTQTGQVRRWVEDGPLGLKVLCFLSCTAAVVTSVLSMLVNAINPFAVVSEGVLMYVAVLALVGAGLEVQQCVASRRLRRKVEVWARVLTRVRGRGCLYIILGLMQLSTGGLLVTVSGACLVAVGCLSVGVGWRATRKLNRLHKAAVVATGGGVDEEGAEQEMRRVFDAQDRDSNGALDRTELAAAATELGVPFDTNELVAVFDLLDVDDDGKISFQEFRDWLRGDKNASLYYAVV